MISGILFLMLQYLSACGTTPSVEKNIVGPEPAGMTMEETPLKPLFNRPINMESYSIALSHDGRYVAVGRTNLVDLFDTLRDGEGKIIESHGIRDVTSLQFSPDGGFLSMGGYGSVEIWSLPEGALYKRIESYGDYITLLSFSPDGRLLAAGSRGGVHLIRIWEIGSGRVVKTLEWDWKYSDEIKAMSFSHDGLRLASVAMDNMIRIWDVKTGLVERSMNRERTYIPVSLSLSPDGEMLAAGTAQGQAILWRVADGAVIRRIDAHRGSIPSVKFSRDGRSLITAGMDQRIHAWDVATGILKETRHVEQPVEKLVLTGDGQTMLALNNRGLASYRITEPAGMPPVIAILFPGDQQVINKPLLSISAKVVDDAGINDIMLELNGVEVQGEGMGVRDLKIRPAGDRKEIDLTWNVTLKRGPNKITVVAYDGENLVTRKSVEVNYAEEHGEVWGAVIGISQYKHIEGLKYADKDARAVYEYLTGDNGIPESHITFLANEEATLQRIKDVLGVEIKGKAREKDTVIIYFAGHGASEPDRDSPDGDGLEKYFLTHDSDPERLYSTALPLQEIARIFSRIDAERIVLI
ncbi:MAG: caspase family protein [Nitrospirae bacterium]|nr:caspase family protein [Nitrospirota bacterium]